MLTITQAQTAEDFGQFQRLLAELSAWDKAMSSQSGVDVDKAMAFLYGDTGHQITDEHMPPAGRLLLATFDGQVCGCMALRKFDEQRGEIKRFYVNPAFRGKGIGRALLDTLISEARQIGYTTLLLETASFMTDAHKLYYAAGFQNIAPYIEIPDFLQPFEIFMEMKLKSDGKT